MRLFIAIDFKPLEQDLKDLQQGVDESLAVLKKTDTFHLTLKFLGKVNEEVAEEVRQRLRKVEFKPFKLELGNIGVFPTENFVRVIWIGIKPSKEIKELQENIEKALEKFGFEKDYEFSPHITLARVKIVKDREKFQKALKGIEVKQDVIDVSDFRLISSKLSPKGAVYYDLEVYQAKP